MLIKLIIVFLLFYIVFSLFKALFCMLKSDAAANSMSHYLGRRVLFSAIVLMIILLAMLFGIITPNSNPYTVS
ncbi:DUF2909 domain-containing protein [Pseudoalteromonas sp. MMG024]|uniref:DUF2909 domain-containing protein n=1 Tax=Pseudoalteromonas sp. MMG024 TaxID=2909980 RepID=UPI001F425AD1|nr:DUF2909 domain-containing protein [Pseudoalteromonas sp. MMG024]MCF6456394.1 DUF2909 domain-containing protein [Pseudoalteromonas sp. MMG024]